MKVVRWISVVILAAAGTCFGDDVNCSSNPLRPSVVPPCTSILGQVSKAMDAMRDFQRASAEATAAIQAARRAYWKVFPDGPGVKEAELKFLDLLLQKDFVYMNYALPLGMNDPVVQMVNLGMMDVDNMGKFPRNVDDGIRPYAFPLFANWVNALRRSQGREHDGAFTNAVIMKTAIEDQSNYRRAYEDARNWAEFMASGLDIRKYLTPQVYMVNEMEADIAIAAAKAKPKDLPEPKRASVDLYNFFVKNLGEKETLAAAAKTLAAPKNSIGGLAQRAEVLIGTYQQQPSPNPYLMFLTQLTNATPHNYALALCLDPYGLMGKEAIFTINSKEQWDKAAATYGQLAAKFGEPAVVAAAARIKDLPKDGTGGIRGDTQSKGAIYWFTALLKDPKTPLPESGQFLASSYDPRWIGKMVNVRGTVSRVDVDKGKFPPYATIHFKESKNDKFTAYTPNPEIIDEILPRGVTSLVGGVIEVYGDVSDWKDGAGVRFLMRNNLKLLDNNALANFKESSPEWMKLPPAPPPSNLADSPKAVAPTAEAAPAPVGRPMNVLNPRERPMNSPPPAAPAPAAAPLATAPATTPPAAASPVVAPEPTPRTARPPVVQPVVRQRPAGSPAATGDQADFMTHYRTTMQHYARDRIFIMQAQRAVTMKAPNAAEMQAALESLRMQQQASSMAMAKQDYAAGNQALQAMEDALTAIETLTAK